MESISPIVLFAIKIIALLVFLFLFFRSIIIVPQMYVVILERWGKYLRTIQPGLAFRVPIMDQIAGKVCLKDTQLSVTVETKTLDDVFVKLIISVQRRITPGKEYDAFYKLSRFDEQMSAYIFDVVRAEVPKLKLDDVFAKKDDIAVAIKNELSANMTGYGVEIIRSLITDIDPDSRVKDAMNKINEAQRLQVAAQAQGEAESKRLQGEGIAKQRTAIIAGLKGSVEEFKAATRAETKEVMNLVLLTQYFDTLGKIGADSKNSVLMIPHNPEGMMNLFEEITKANTVAQQNK